MSLRVRQAGSEKNLLKFILKKDYNLVLNGQNEQGLKEFAEKDNVDIIIGDLTKQETINQIAEIITNKHQQLDILINNADITYIQPFEKNTPEQLEQLLAIDLKAPMLLTHELYPLMVKQQSKTIININSSAGKEGKANHTMYSAAKFGLYGFSQSLRLEAKQHGIRVISIHPGGVNTPLYDSLEKPVDAFNYMDTKKVAELIATLSETGGLSPDEITINRFIK